MSIDKQDGATYFGDLADTFCNSVLGMGRVYQRFDVVFDRYTQASIRGGTRKDQRMYANLTAGRRYCRK